MTDKRPAVYIEGIAIDIGWADARRSLTELIFSTTRRAIDHGKKSLETIDSVVLAAHDMVDGRSLSSMVTGPAAGAYLRDETRYSDDGAAAFAAAVTRVEAKESIRSIVAAWGRASEHNVEAVARATFDPFFAAPFGIDELQASAMRAQAWMRMGGDVGARADAATRRAAAAHANPRALRAGGRSPVASYPLNDADMPRWADVFVSVTISAEPSAVRVAGVGQSSEPYWLGDRKLGRLAGLERAAVRALQDAGINAQQLDLVEIDGLTLFDEAIGMEAVGIAAKGGGFKALADDPRSNPSGGAAAGYCAPAMGLVRIVEAVIQLQGRAGAVQVPRARRALATGSCVVAAQTHTAVVLEAT
jgi:acetyl-CoA C-acetyltransferase